MLLRISSRRPKKDARKACTLLEGKESKNENGGIISVAYCQLLLFTRKEVTKKKCRNLNPLSMCDKHLGFGDHNTSRRG